jgi:hypothetical protein
VLSPSRYVELAEVESTAEDFDSKMRDLVMRLSEDLNRSKRAEKEMIDELRRIGFDVKI